MKEGNHERAAQLIDTRQVESISAADGEWLKGHLEGCVACRERAQSTERALQSLRSAIATVNPSLVTRTQLRVRLRAQELREQQAGMRALWVSCAFSWILGAVSAPLLWQGLEWLGRRIVLPRAVWLMVFVFWWLAPAVAVAAVLVWHRSRASMENGYEVKTPW